jgi:hypothetical protein
MIPTPTLLSYVCGRFAYVVNGDFGSERGERNAMGIVL